MEPASRLRIWTVRLVLASTAVVVSGCGVLYPRGFKGQVLTDDGRADVPCDLSLYERLNSPNPTLIATLSVRTGESFEKNIQLNGTERTDSAELWVSANCDGYIPHVRGFDVEHLSVWMARVVDLGPVTVQHE